MCGARAQEQVVACQRRSPERAVHAAHHVAQRQVGRSLCRQPRHVHEASTCASSRRATRQQMHQPIQHVVAHKGACGLRHFAGNARALHGTHHGFDGQAREVRRWATLNDWCVDGLAALVVCNAGVVDVDAHTLQRQGTAPARLPQAQSDGGLVLCEQRLQPLQRRSKDGRQLGCHHPEACHVLAVQRLGNQPTGVLGVAPKRIEAGEQDDGLGQRHGVHGWRLGWG